MVEIPRASTARSLGRVATVKVGRSGQARRRTDTVVAVFGRCPATGTAQRTCRGMIRCTSNTKKCGDSWACPSNLHDRYPISGRQHERRLKAGAAAFPRKPLGDRRFRAFAVRSENSSNGRARFCAPRVVLRFEGPENGFGTFKGLNPGFCLGNGSKFNPGAMAVALRKARPLEG